MTFEFSPATCELAEFIRNRRTVNDFESRTPPLEVVLQGIELARWAPNHRLTQPWRFHILGPKSRQLLVNLNTQLVREKKGDEAAAKKQAKWEQVPSWLLVTCQRSDDPVIDEENYAAVACAIQNLALYWWSQGIGMKWSTGGVMSHVRLAEELNFDPAKERAVALISYGYPAKVPAMKRQDVAKITTIHP